MIMFVILLILVVIIFAFIANFKNHNDETSDSYQKTEKNYNENNFIFSFESIDDARRFENKKIQIAKNNGCNMDRPLPLSIGFIYFAETVATIAERSIKCTKIGFTLRDPKVRIIELNEDNAVDYQNLDINSPNLPMYPNMQFSLVRAYKIKGCYEVEQLIHNELKKSGDWLWGELFKTQIDRIDVCLKKQIENIDGAELITGSNSENFNQKIDENIKIENEMVLTEEEKAKFNSILRDFSEDECIVINKYTRLIMKMHESNITNAWSVLAKKTKTNIIGS